MICREEKSAFTLVEVLVSIAILAIIFTFLFNVSNSTKKSNHHYIAKSNKLLSESKIFNTFMLDLSQSTGNIAVIYGRKYDIVRIQTKNSVYGIISPYVTYFVSKKDLALIRTESLGKYDLYKKDDIESAYIYGDILSKETISFKLLYKNGFINLLFRAKGLSPIVLKIPRVQL